MANTNKRAATNKSRVKTALNSDLAEPVQPQSYNSARAPMQSELSRALLYQLRVKVLNVWCAIGGPVFNVWEASVVTFFLLVALYLGVFGAVKQLTKLVSLLQS